MFWGDWITQRIKQEKHVCVYWIDEEIMDDLIKLDKNDGKDRAKRYREQCHEPIVRVTPNENIKHTKVILECKPNSIRSEKCNFQNERLRTEIYEEIINFKEDNGNHRTEKRKIKK